MKGEKIPDEHHITRYCGGAQINPDGTISGAAFRLRMISGQIESFLSVNWIENLKKNNRDEEIEEIRKVLSGKLKLGSAARIAILNVKQMCDHVQKGSEDQRVLQVLHEPDEPNDPSHSGIHNLRLEDDAISDLIALTVKDIYPAKID